MTRAARLSAWIHRRATLKKQILLGIAFISQNCLREREAFRDPAHDGAVHAQPLVSAPEGGHASRHDAKSGQHPDGLGGAGPVGDAGNWSKCYAHFAPRGDAALDVLRLGLLCGPSNGMRKVLDVADGRLGSAPQDYSFSARPGDCFRIMAVADFSASAFAVEVRDEHAAKTARVESHGQWLILEQGSPLCVTRGGEYHVLVETGGDQHSRPSIRDASGAGRYALELWRLRH